MTTFLNDNFNNTPQKSKLQVNANKIKIDMIYTTKSIHNSNLISILMSQNSNSIEKINK